MVLFLFLIQDYCLGQNLRQWDGRIDSLQIQYENASFDSVRVQTAINLVGVLGNKAWITTNTGQFAVAYESFRKAFDFWENPETIKLFEKVNHDKEYEKSYWSVLANLTFNYGHLMGATGNSEERLYYYQKAYQIAKEREDMMNTVFSLTGLAFVYLNNNELDSAQMKIEEASSYPPEFYNFEGYPEIKYIEWCNQACAEAEQACFKRFLGWSQGCH